MTRHARRRAAHHSTGDPSMHLTDWRPGLHNRNRRLGGGRVMEPMLRHGRRSPGVSMPSMRRPARCVRRMPASSTAIVRQYRPACGATGTTSRKSSAFQHPSASADTDRPKISTRMRGNPACMYGRPCGCARVFKLPSHLIINASINNSTASRHRHRHLRELLAHRCRCRCRCHGSR